MPDAKAIQQLRQHFHNKYEWPRSGKFESRLVPKSLIWVKANKKMSDVPEKPDPKAVAKRNKQVFLVVRNAAARSCKRTTV